MVHHMSGWAQRQPGRWMLVWLLTLPLVGCGSGEPSGQVSGKVTHNGAAVAGAEMNFQSTTNADQVFNAISGEDGAYQVDYRALEGLPPGKYKVTIRRYTLAGGKPLPEGEAGDELKEQGRVVMSMVVFEQEIVEGENALDFELTKGQKGGA